jgi:hypothetical protein
MMTCYPSNPVAQCRVCVRRRRGEPAQPEERPMVMDASVAARDGFCELWEPRELAAPARRRASWLDVVVGEQS